MPFAEKEDFQVLDPIFVPPVPAKLGYRTIAFVLDCILALALSMLAIKFVLFTASPKTFALIQGFVDQYLQVMEQVKAGAIPPDQAMGHLNITEEILAACGRAFMVTFFSIWAYFSLSEWLMAGASLGKKVFRLCTLHHVLKRPPNLWESLLRGGLKSISLLALMTIPEVFTGNPVSILFALLSLDYFVAFYHPGRRALHDLATRTSVTQPAPSALLDEIA